MKNVFLLITLLLLSGCATRVNVDYDVDSNFSTIKTFQIQSEPANKTSDSRTNNSFMKKRVIKAVGDTLTIKGMNFVKVMPDVIIQYQLGINKELESDDSGISIGFGTSSRHSAIGLVYGFPASEVSTVENLVMSIDIVDARTKQLLWRGSLARRLYDGSTPETHTQLVNEMVAEILKQFPPK